MSLISGRRRVVELRNGLAHGKRIDVVEGCGRVAVPIQQGGSFVVASYVPSGLNTADGVEIWIELENSPPIH